MRDQNDALFDNPKNRSLSRSQARAARKAEKTQKNSAPAPLTGRTPRQKDYVESLREGNSAFAVGPAGTGKTYIPARIAARQLVDQKIEKIIVGRVTAAPDRHRQGFLPGKLDQKLKPWMIPVIDAIKAEVSSNTLEQWMQDGRFEIISFEHLRGRTLKNAFVILDEGQNATFSDLKLFLTRIGEDTQVVVTGDIEQIDIRDSGLTRVIEIAEAYDLPMDVIEFDEDDCVRSAFTRAWVRAFAASDDPDHHANLDRLPSFLHTPEVTKP